MVAVTKEKDKLALISAIFILLLFGVSQFGMGKIYGPYLFPDEIGYWGAAATMKGYDWSDIISLGGYYSYGYGILLYPILLLTNNPITMYRIAIFLNFLLLSSAFLLLFQIVKRIFTEIDRKHLLFISIAGIAYSSWIFYMQVTLSEILLMTLYLLIVYLLLLYLEKPKSIIAIAMAASLTMLYFVHMRTIGIIIAAVLVFLLLLIFKEKYRKSTLLLIGVGILFLVLGLWGKDEITDSLYHTTQVTDLAINDYSGQWEKIQGIFTWKGLKDLLLSCMGKLFYLGISTFGLFYWGVWYLIKQSIQAFRNKGKVQILCFFLLLSMLGQFGVSAIFMIDGGYMDTTIYGRYNEIFLPIIISLGLLEMYQSRWILQKTLMLTFTQGIFIIILAVLWQQAEMPFRHGCFIVGVSYAIERFAFDAASFWKITLIVGSLLYFFTAIIVLLIKKQKEWFWLLCLLACLQLGIGLHASKEYTYLHNAYNYKDVKMAEEITELAKQGKEIYFSNSLESAEYIGLMQYALQEHSIHLIKEKNETSYLKQDYVVLTYKTNEHLEIFRNYYKNETEATHFYAFYN